MSNLNVSHALIGGRLTADPRLETTPGGVSVTSFTIAVNRRQKDGTSTPDFYRCRAYGGTAEFITRFFHKADSIFVSGMMEIEQWTDKTGGKCCAPRIKIENAYFVDAKSDKSFTSGSPALDELGADEDLPF